MLDLSITIISWKAKDLLHSCLQSIYQNTEGISMEIIVVDNGSFDGSSEMVEEKFPGVLLIKNEGNRGVAPARNQALARTKGRYVLILDVDTEITAGALTAMIDFMDCTPEVGLVGPKLVDTDRKLRLSCRKFHTIFTPFLRRFSNLPLVARSRMLREYQMEGWDHITPAKVDHVIGACQMIRRKALDVVGYLDDKMFYGWEDTDYCLRMWRKGYSVYYYPYSVVIHHEQRITKEQFISRITLEHIKSMIRFFSKYPTGIWGKY
jgi:N-acetylglucosaminyl-diphospho-decaprenol L-rhamnosyltransferase